MLILNRHEINLTNLFLNLSDCFPGVETFRTGLGAVHDRVALVQLEGVVQLGEAFFGLDVSGVGDPAVSLH